MNLSEERCAGLGVALNESALLGFEISPVDRVAAATFRCLTLPVEEPSPADSRFQFLFRRVGRVAVSLRNGRWDDPNADVVPVDLGELLTVVQSFHGLPIYGWEFFDVHEAAPAKWGDRLSLDWRSGETGLSHSICVFQDPGNRILDICVWFDELEIRTPLGEQVSIDDFILGGKRWWDGLYGNDSRTTGHGIVPMKANMASADQPSSKPTRASGQGILSRTAERIRWWGKR